MQHLTVVILSKETWNDRSDVENSNGMHRSEYMEEKLSLVNLLVLQLTTQNQSQKEYFEIVFELATKQESRWEKMN